MSLALALSLHPLTSLPEMLMTYDSSMIRPFQVCIYRKNIYNDCYVTCYVTPSAPLKGNICIPNRVFPLNPFQPAIIEVNTYTTAAAAAAAAIDRNDYSDYSEDDDDDYNTSINLYTLSKIRDYLRLTWSMTSLNQTSRPPSSVSEMSFESFV